jgi:hypothetical protein
MKRTTGAGSERTCGGVLVYDIGDDRIMLRVVIRAFINE